MNLDLQWSYDRYGNRWTQAVTAVAAPAPSAAFSGGNNRLDGKSYDAENRLIAVDGGQTASYQYDAEGRRQRRQANGSTWDTLFDLDGTAGTVLLWAPSGAYSGWARSEICVPGRHLATYQDGTTYFAHLGPLGTERLRSKPDGSLYETCVSLPFGDGLNCSFPNGAATDSPLHFTGKPRDPETGLDYFGARYNDSSLGRWMSPDWSAQAEPVPYAKLDNPQSLNLYTYVLNNPVTSDDKDGHCIEDACVAEGGAAIVVLGTAAVLGVDAWLHTPAGQSSTEAFAKAAGASISRSISVIKSVLHKSTSNPLTGKPGSKSTVYHPDGKPRQTREYGKDGYPKTDVDSGHDHNGSGDPHAHDWGRPSDGGKPTNADRGPGRPVQPTDPKPDPPPPPRNCPQGCK